jgi:uncharacterized protein DUF6790
MGALAPPLTFALSWLFALIGWNAPGTDSSTPFDEEALRWILYIGVGWTGVVASAMHTVFAKQTAKSIGWQTSGFQFEVGFANLAVGLGGSTPPLTIRPRAGLQRRWQPAPSCCWRGSTTSSRSSATGTTRPATPRS